MILPTSQLGVRGARKAVPGGAIWQRCQFHLAQNAIHHAPTAAIRKRIGGQLRETWNAEDLAGAEAALKTLVAACRNPGRSLAQPWSQPGATRRQSWPPGSRSPSPKLWLSSPCQSITANPIERAVQQELKRRTVEVRVFPNNASLLRLVTAVFVEIDETWPASTRPHINWNTPDA